MKDSPVDSGVRWAEFRVSIIDDKSGALRVRGRCIRDRVSIGDTFREMISALDGHQSRLDVQLFVQGMDVFGDGKTMALAMTGQLELSGSATDLNLVHTGCVLRISR